MSLRPDLAAEILWRSALAFDLETDGKDIWQIGVADASGSTLTFDADGTDTLQEALKNLQQDLGAAALVVGHNLVAWDLPVVASAVDASIDHYLVWDTLLVSLLLDPTATSHALGGSHRADTDADDARADDTLAALATLRDRGGVTITWSLSVSPLRLWKQPFDRTEALIAAVEATIEELLNQATANKAEIDPDVLLQRIATMQENALSTDSEDNPWLGMSEDDRNLFREARGWAVKSLALSCGVSLRQAYVHDRLVWRVRLTLMQDGREVTVLDLSGTGITWSQLFESIARRGTTVTDAARDNHV